MYIGVYYVNLFHNVEKFKFQDLYKINNNKLMIWLFVNQDSYGPE